MQLGAPVKSQYVAAWKMRHCQAPSVPDRLAGLRAAIRDDQAAASEALAAKYTPSSTINGKRGTNHRAFVEKGPQTSAAS
jgi:hypothetical protein